MDTGMRRFINNEEVFPPNWTLIKQEPKMTVYDVAKEAGITLNKCFRCELPIAKAHFYGTDYCGCKIPDVMGASLVEKTIKQNKENLRMFGVEYNPYLGDIIDTVLPPIPTPTKAVTPTPTKALTPSVSPTKTFYPLVSKEIGDIFVDNNTGEMYIWEGDIFRQIAPTDFDMNDYEVVSDSVDKLIQTQKLAEKPLDTTHPTVLTWLIRKVELWDILDIFYHLEKIGERNALLVQCDSFSAAFRALGNTRLYLVTGFDFNALRKKYFEDDGTGYYSGEIVNPINI